MTELREKDGKLDTKSMLEDGFFAEFAKGDGELPRKDPSLNVPTANNKRALAASPSSANTEQLLVDAYTVRDDLISSFSEVKLGSALADNMKNAINKIGSMIVNMGGESENFDPLSHVSGLDAPNLNKYASRVIENTIDAYSLGQISDAKIDDTGKSIIITFAGRVDDMLPYKAVGTISTAGSWLGTEAIDYVYTPGAGKMSVKVANNEGVWEDKSDQYSVSWELFEGEEEKDAEKNIEKKLKLKRKNLI